MALSAEELADYRAEMEEWMVDSCKVYREVTGDSNDPEAASDGEGGFNETYSGAVEGKKQVHTYKCRETVPRGSSSINEENNFNEVNAYLRALICLPWNADIRAADILIITNSETGEIREYESKEPLPHSESISLHVIAVRVKE